MKSAKPNKTGTSLLTDSQSKITLHPALRLFPTSRGALIASDEFTRNFDQPALLQLLEALSASPQMNQLQNLLSDKGIPPALVDVLIQSLVDQQIAVPVSRTFSIRENAAFWLAAECTPGPLRLDVQTLGATLPLELEQLASFLPSPPHGPILRVIVTDDYLKPEVAEACRAVKTPTLLVRPTGRRFWLGPIFQDGGGACYDCLEFFLTLHRWRQQEADLPYPPAPAVAALNSSLALASAMTAAVVERFAAYGDVPELNSAFQIVDPWSSRSEHAPFLSRRNCPRCASEFPLEHRLHALSHPLTGILENVKVEPIGETGSYTALAGVLVPQPVRRRRLFAPPLAACGKGNSPQHAQQILTFEATERYSAAFHGSEPLVRATAREIAPPYALSVLFQLGAKQYTESGAPALLAADQPIAWTMARSFATGAEVPIPAGFAFVDYSFESEPRYHVADTNGCAAADSLELAQTHAVVELIERDALAIWWYNQLPRPTVSLPAHDDIDGARQALARAGRALHFFDLTNDLGIPVIAATSATTTGSAIYLGAAAGLCPVQAAARAAAELLQFWHWDTSQQRHAASRAAWLATATYQSHPFLDPQRAPTSVTLKRRRLLPAPLPALLSAVSSRGFDSCWLDLTRPELGIPVVRVIVPGLRHHQRRLASGRLFDLPVTLGWKSKRTPTSACNQFHVPL